MIARVRLVISDTQNKSTQTAGQREQAGEVERGGRASSIILLLWGAVHREPQLKLLVV